MLWIQCYVAKKTVYNTSGGENRLCGASLHKSYKISLKDYMHRLLSMATGTPKATTAYQSIACLRSYHKSESIINYVILCHDHRESKYL